MNCGEARKWISPYLDSELDATKTFEVSQHLEACPPCRKRFDQEIQADRLTAESLRRVEPGVDWAEVERSLTAEPRRHFLLRPRWMLAAAAAVAFLVLGFGEWSRSSNAGNPAKWAVDELHRLSPDSSPFRSQEGCTPLDVATAAYDILTCHLDLPCGDGPVTGRPVTLVKALRRDCPGGKGRLEVQLNYDGKPVLLTIGKCNELGELRRVRDELGTGDKQLSRTCRAYKNTYHVSSRRVGDYVIVAVSPHDTNPLVSDIVLAAK